MEVLFEIGALGTLGDHGYIYLNKSIVYLDKLFNGRVWKIIQKILAIYLRWEMVSGALSF